MLQFLISWGIVGAAGGLWLLARAILTTHRTGMADEALRLLAATLYSLLFMNLREGMLYYPHEDGPTRKSCDAGAQWP